MKRKERWAEVDIAHLSPKSGNGIGKAVLESGHVTEAEVAFAIPGDLIRARITSKKRGRYQTDKQEVLRPSPDRVPARCPHFSSCGGCRWQYLSYEKQLQEKEQIVKQAFHQQLTEEVVFHPIIACDSPWAYRNKMEFSFHNNLAGDQFLGLMLSGSRGKVLQLQECHLVESWMVDGVKATREWWKASGLNAFHHPSERGSLRNLTFRQGTRTGDRMAILNVSGNPEYALSKQQLQTFTGALKAAITPNSSDAKLSIFLKIQQAIKGQATQFYEMLLFGPDHIREELYIEQAGERYCLQFCVSPQAFFQPNSRQAEKLYSRALQLAQVPANGLVYDLYCGTGTLAICAAKYARQVIGIELSPESSLDARTNAKLNGFENVTIITGDAGVHLAALQNGSAKPDLVMVDPPRAGLDHAAITHLLALQAPVLLYISCNPLSQAENIQELCNGGYTLKCLQPLDQCPHTPHIENIAVLHWQAKESSCVLL